LGQRRPPRADVEPESIGRALTALIGIVQDSGSHTDDVLDAIRAMREIESCYFMAGVESYLLKARVGTIAALEQLIVGLNRTPGVASTRTTVALSTKWENRPHVRAGGT
jgi:Lrp/AsnC family leucine-responsive transcriptional regulator